MYKSVSNHPEDLAGGSVLGPGETTEGIKFDAEDPHNKRLIEEGILIPIEAATTKIPAPLPKTEEGSK